MRLLHGLAEQDVVLADHVLPLAHEQTLLTHPKFAVEKQSADVEQDPPFRFT
jgi:hypothetical protein